MWNVSSNNTNLYYGANFVNYIGQINKTLMMVRPTNGQGYDTFIFSQYFDVVVEGYNAATASTVEVIALINKIPTSVTLDSESLINAARTAYDNISSTEQKALVTNYSKLADAESLLAYLKNRDITPTPVVDVTTEPSAVAVFFANNMVGLIIAGVLLLAVAGLVAYIIVIKKKKN
jgi:hypothetical protein